MIIESIIGALVPIGAEAIKQITTKWFGGVQPTTIEDKLKLDASDIERLKAIALLDQPVGTPSQWVVDLRASARYIGALAVIACGIGSMFIVGLPTAVYVTALEAANIAFGFLFGQRIVSSWSNK
jgi:hypothetical protein